MCIRDSLRHFCLRRHFRHRSWWSGVHTKRLEAQNAPPPRRFSVVGGSPANASSGLVARANVSIAAHAVLPNREVRSKRFMSLVPLHPHKRAFPDARTPHSAGYARHSSTRYGNVKGGRACRVREERWVRREITAGRTYPS